MGKFLSNKELHKITMRILKVLPMVISACIIVNTFLDLLNIKCAILSFIAGTSILNIIFLLFISFVFKFCFYHRMFIYYILVTDIINIIIFSIHIDRLAISTNAIIVILLGIFCFGSLYKYKYVECY